MKSLQGFLEAQRSLFDECKAKAVAISKTGCFKEVCLRRVKRVIGDPETDVRFLFLRHHELENSEGKDSLSRLTSFYFDDLDAEMFYEWLQ